MRPPSPRSISLVFVLGLTACASGQQDPTSGPGGSGGSGAGGAVSAGGSGGAGGGIPLGGGGPCGAFPCSGDVEWVKRYGPGSAQQFSWGLGVDGLGTATIAGSYNPTIDLGAFQLTTAGGLDMYWAKVGPDGTTVAAKSFGGSGNELATGVVVDRKGRSVFHGVFSGPLDFGNGPLEAQNFRMFLALLGPDGTALWSHAFGEMVNASSQTAAIDSDGNVIFSAGYYGDIDFGAGPVTGGAQSLTVTKFSPAGDALWSKKLAASMAHTMTVLGDGSIVLTANGLAVEPADIGCGSPVAGRSLGRLSPDGDCLWQLPVDGPAIDGLFAEGDVLALHARINQTATIGDTTFSVPGGKVLVATMDPDGQFKSSFVIADEVEIEALAVDGDGGVVFEGSMKNGSAVVGDQLFTGDSFLVRLGPAGEWLWGKAFVGSADFPAAAGIGPFGHVYLYGRTIGPIDFGTGVLTGGPGSPDEDVVLAKFKP